MVLLEVIDVSYCNGIHYTNTWALLYSLLS